MAYRQFYSQLPITENWGKIHSGAIAGLEKELKVGKGFSSYGAIVEWLLQEYGLEIEYATVYSLVRYKLGAKLKVPRPQIHKQDEKLVSEFKKTVLRSVLWRINIKMPI